MEIVEFANRVDSDEVGENEPQPPPHPTPPSGCTLFATLSLNSQCSTACTKLFFNFADINFWMHQGVIS